MTKVIGAKEEIQINEIDIKEIKIPESIPRIHTLLEKEAPPEGELCSFVKEIEYTTFILKITNTVEVKYR